MKGKKLNEKDRRVLEAAQKLLEENPKGLLDAHKRLGEELKMAPNEVLVILKRLTHAGKVHVFNVGSSLTCLTLNSKSAGGLMPRLGHVGNGKITVPDAREKPEAEPRVVPDPPTEDPEARVARLQERFRDLAERYRQATADLKSERERRELVSGRLRRAQDENVQLAARIVKLDRRNEDLTQRLKNAVPAESQVTRIENLLEGL